MAKIKYLNKRKKFFWRVVFIFSILITFFLGTTWSLFYFDKFKVKKINIEGNSILSEEELREEVKSILTAKVLGILPGDSIFFVPQDKIINHLFSQFKKLESIDLRKNFPSAMTIRITEREPGVLLCLSADQAGENTKECFFVDDSAFIFEEAPFFSSGVFLRFFDERQHKPALGEFLLENDIFEALLVFKKQIGQHYPIKEIHLKDEGIYEIYTKDGWYLILDEEEDWALTYANFVTFLNEVIKDRDENLEYIDLRFGNKIFYK